MADRKLRLGAFIMATGHHVAAWRHPGSQADSGVNIDHYIEVAKTAERGLFDQVFVADSPGLWHQGDDESLSRQGRVSYFEPVTLWLVRQHPAAAPFRALARLTASDLEVGLTTQAARRFIDFWSGSGAFASLAFALVAMPLSLRAPRDERLLGLILSFVLVMLYYLLYFMGKMMGSRVSITYEQHKGVPTSCFGETEYFVVGVEKASS